MNSQQNARTLAIYAMAFGNFAAGMSSLVMAGVLTDIASSLNVTAGQAGQLISIYSFAYAIGATLFITITSRYERRVMLALGMSLVFLGNGAAALAPTYGLLFAARVLTAVGGSMYVPLSTAVAVSLARPEERGRVKAVVFSGFTLATALGLPIGTYIGLNLGWRFTFGTVAVLAVISSFFILRELPRDIVTPPANIAIFSQVFRNGLLVMVLAITILQFGGQMVLFAFISPWLQAFTDLESAGISFMLLIIGVGGIAGNYLCGISADRFGARVTQLVLIIALAGIMAAMPLIAASIILGGLLMFLWGFVGQGFIAPQLVRLVGVDPELSSASLSLNSSFINIGVALGAVTGGIVIDQVGVGALTWLGVGGILIALMMFGMSWVMENGRNRVQSAVT